MGAMSEPDFDRLCDWIGSHPDLQDLFVRALELEARRRREGQDE
jgi:hypothetical protein